MKESYLFMLVYNMVTSKWIVFAATEKQDKTLTGGIIKPLVIPILWTKPSLANHRSQHFDMKFPAVSERPVEIQLLTYHIPLPTETSISTTLSTQVRYLYKLLK